MKIVKPNLFSYNSYITPKGNKYILEGNKPFEVKDKEDIEWFVSTQDCVEFGKAELKETKKKAVKAVSE